jgi:hypothetical protein
MRIVFTTEGGLAFFPGLSRPIVIDSHDLSAAEAAELERLLDSARFFELPEDSRALHRGAADYRQYTVRVENRYRRHTVRLADPVENPQLQALLDFLRRHAQRPAVPESVV